MISPRYFIRLATTFITRFKELIFLGIFIGILFFLIFKLFLSSYETRQIEKIGAVGRYRLDNLPLSITNLIGEGLTKLDNNGLIQPALAGSWSSPDNGKTWIFKIKPEKYWQDGKKVTSGGIVYQFSDATIERPDEETIIFKLQNQFAPFPEVVSRPTFRKGLLGTGNWKVVKVSIVGNFVENITLVDKSKNKKIYKFYPTEERTKLAYKLGQVNKLVDIVNKDIFTGWRNVIINEEVNINRIVAIFFNTEDKLLSEKSLRQSLAYGIDKNLLSKARTISPISPNSWAYNAQVKPYNYDTARAKELIADLPKDLLAKASVRLVTIPVLLPVAEKIAKNWEALGIKTIVQVSSGVPSEFQAFLAIFDTPQDPDQYAIWHSTQLNTNITHYKNPRIDKLLEDGRTQLNQAERKKTYLDFQRFLVEDSPAVFLYHPTLYTIERK
jgi:peptide/nickel transport system substrate-binding protein